MLLNFKEEHHLKYLLNVDTKRLPVYFYNDYTSIFIPLDYCSCCGGRFGYEYNMKTNMYEWQCICYDDIKLQSCSCEEDHIKCTAKDCGLHIKKGETNDKRNYYFTLFFNDVFRTIWQRKSVNFKIVYDQPIQLETISIIAKFINSSNYITYTYYMQNCIIVHIEYKTAFSLFKLYVSFTYKRIHHILGNIFQKLFHKNLNIPNISDERLTSVNYIYCLSAWGRKGLFKHYEKEVNRIFDSHAKKYNENESKDI